MKESNLVYDSSWNKSRRADMILRVGFGLSLSVILVIISIDELIVMLGWIVFLCSVSLLFLKSVQPIKVYNDSIRLPFLHCRSKPQRISMTEIDSIIKEKSKSSNKGRLVIRTKSGYEYIIRNYVGILDQNTLVDELLSALEDVMGESFKELYQENKYSTKREVWYIWIFFGMFFFLMSFVGKLMDGEAGKGLMGLAGASLLGIIFGTIGAYFDPEPKKEMFNFLICMFVAAIFGVIITWLMTRAWNIAIVGGFLGMIMGGLSSNSLMEDRDEAK